jgi:peptidyl-prolyl cis-trans isomerase B (cyclophilin B)
MSDATVQTNRGAIRIELFSADAPRTVGNFEELSRNSFYDGLTFHRVIEGFMIQGGDPRGDGTGGPGYTFEDEPNEHRIVRGALAMANAGPDTNGSQFFVISGPDGVALPPKYSLFGKVVKGLDVVAAIDAVGTRSGTPKEKVTITSVTITEPD